MAWLHTWSGLLLGWLLFTIFLAGTASYFREEISRYMRPELAAVAFDPVRAADAAQRYLTRHASAATRWSVTLPSARNPDELSVFWRDAERRSHSHLVDVRTGERALVRDTRGGDFFYRLHFDLHYVSARTARWIVGFAAMMMLVAIVSGVITHKRIFRDFFTFRAGKGQRAWLDAHNVLAVLPLPYHALITYTGLVTLMFMYMPWGVSSQYGEKTTPFFDTVFGQSAALEPSGDTANLAPLGGMVNRAQRHWQGAHAGFISVSNPGDRAARVDVRRGQGCDVAVSTAGIEFDHRGVWLRELDSSGGAARVREVLYGLHLGRFAPPVLRALLFVLGLAGTAMVATGLVLWGVKRSRSRERAGAGDRVVAVLNVAVVAGLPLAMAALFWANRLLPIEMNDRAEWEIHAFFVVWAGALVMALVRCDQYGWRRLLGAAAIAFAGVPLINALTTERGLIHSLVSGDWLFAAFDFAMLTIAVVFTAAVWLLGSRQNAGREVPRVLRKAEV